MSNTPIPNTPRLPQIAYLWLYLQTQWRRSFGLNMSKIDDFMFVGGEFRAWQWPTLYQHGIRAVLSLQAERADVFDGPPPTHTLRLEVPDFYPPTIDQLHTAVAFIQTTRDAGLPVLIHCHAGVGRAALTATAYLMSQGLSHAAAFAQVKRARPIVELNAQQYARLVEWEQIQHNS